MDYEPCNIVSKSSSAPDLRLLLEGVKPVIPQPLLTSYDRPDMSSLATALVPYKPPLVNDPSKLWFDSMILNPCPLFKYMLALTEAAHQSIVNQPDNLKDTGPLKNNNSFQG